MDVGSFETVEVTLSDHVLTITLNRPQALNSFNRAMLDEFSRLWAWAATDDEVHVIVLRANGDRAFSTGADVKEGYQLHENPFSRTDPGAHLSPKQNRCWKPLICAVHGMVAGGALYWLNEADVIIAADDAQFFDPHVSYGLVAALEPIGLVRRIPIGEVLRMTLLGLDERMSARRALEIGFVTEILPREQLWDRAAQLAARIAAKPPVAIQGSVRAIWESLDATRSHALATGLSYTDIGNPISIQQVTRGEVRHDGFDVR